METPFAPRDHGVSLPSIYIDESTRRTPGFSTFSPPLSAHPMSIPQSSSHHNPPPPLPPPKYVPVDGPNSIDAERYRRREYEATVEELPHYKTRFERDEGYHSLDSPRQQNPFSGSAHFGMHHNQFQFKSSADAYDSSLLKKLDLKRTLENRSPPRRSGLSSSARDPLRPTERYPLLPTLSLPTRIKPQPQSSLLDSPGRYTETPLHSAASPRSTPFGHSDYRQPLDPVDLEQSPVARTRRTNSGSVPDDVTVSTQGSYDMGADDDFPMDETTRLRDFHIDGALARTGEYHTVGLKRRASSPPGDEPPTHGIATSSDLLRRREGVSRGSPTPRLSVIPQGSISSISSAGRSNSYQSSLSFNHGRRSPGGLSSGAMSPTESTVCNSPYATPMSLTTSPRSSVARTPHHRTLSEQRALASPRKLTEIKPNITNKMQGFICDCCPKKPKKFETAAELR